MNPLIISDSTVDKFALMSNLLTKSTSASYLDKTKLILANQSIGKNSITKRNTEKTNFMEAAKQRLCSNSESALDAFNLMTNVSKDSVSAPCLDNYKLTLEYHQSKAKILTSERAIEDVGAVKKRLFCNTDETHWVTHSSKNSASPPYLTIPKLTLDNQDIEIKSTSERSTDQKDNEKAHLEATRLQLYYNAMLRDDSSNSSDYTSLESESESESLSNFENFLSLNLNVDNDSSSSSSHSLENMKVSPASEENVVYEPTRNAKNCFKDWDSLQKQIENIRDTLIFYKDGKPSYTTTGCYRI